MQHPLARSLMNGETHQRILFQETIAMENLEVSFDYDFETEEFTCRRLSNDGFLINDDGNEIRLDELTLWELGYILDEIEANNFTIINESE